jgi:tetratricopeptide (TPR) repeat protein
VQRVFLGTSITPPAPVASTGSRARARVSAVGRLTLRACVCIAIWIAPPAWAAGQDRVETPTAADAPERRGEPPAEALKHYERGRNLYQAGRYREALTELEQALELDPNSPNLVYNVARVHELLGEIDLAIEHYVRYQKLLPPAQTEEIARVESTLQRLAGAREHVTPEPATEAPRPSGPPRRERGVADAAFWTLTATSAAALAGGGGVGFMALRADQEVQDFVVGQDGDLRARNELANRADRLALASDLTLLAGATLGVTAILLYALRTKPVREAAVPAPRAVVELGAWSGGAMLNIRGRL